MDLQSKVEGRVWPVDDAALRVTAQPAVPAAARHGASDSAFLAVERTRKKLAKIALSSWMVLPSISGLCYGRVLNLAIRRGVSKTRQHLLGFRHSLPSPASRFSPGNRRCTSRTPSRLHQRRRVTLAAFLGRPRCTAIRRRTGDNLEGPTDPELTQSLANPRLSVLGVMWNKVDDMMHGMKMQTAGMHSHVRLWASQGHLQKLLGRLQQEGFAVISPPIMAT